MENKIKHLEFIQNIITRLANNSFMLKGWSITLVSAILGFVYNDPKTYPVIFISIIPVMFWILDSYFLYQERLYRKLYDNVRKLEQSNIDFSMVVSPYRFGWIKTFFSKTIIIFYAPLVIIPFLILKPF